MLLCTCGCRAGIHEDLGPERPRGRCWRCGCEWFVDAKSVIEAEVAAELDAAGKALIAAVEADRSPEPTTPVEEATALLEEILPAVEQCPHPKADDGLCWVPDCPEGPDSRRPPRVEPPEVTRARERLAKLTPAEHAEVTADFHRLIDMTAAGVAIDAATFFQESHGCRPAAPPPPVDEPLPLATYDAWWCPQCGSRAFELRRCCDHRPMTPIRVEIHARDSP